MGALQLEAFCAGFHYGHFRVVERFLFGFGRFWLIRLDTLLSRTLLA